MAGSFSNYAELKILDHITGKTSFTKPTCYVALCTGNPGEAGTGASMSEVADANNYARVTTAGADWNAAATGAVDNANAIIFLEASGSWGTVSHFALLDSGTYGVGNILAYGTLDSSKAVGAGDTPTFAAGALDITLD